MHLKDKEPLNSKAGVHSPICDDDQIPKQPMELLFDHSGKVVGLTKKKIVNNLYFFN